MNKSELISVLSEKTNSTKRDAEKFLNAFIETVEETLKANDDIKIVGFGTFTTKVTKERITANPRNPKEKIKVPSRTVPILRIGKAFKEKFN